MDDVKETIYFVIVVYETTSYFSARMMIYCIEGVAMTQMCPDVSISTFFNAWLVLHNFPWGKRSTLLAYLKK